MLLFCCCTAIAAAQEVAVPVNSHPLPHKYMVHRKGISPKTANKIREVERISRKVALIEAKIKKKEAEIARVEAHEQ